MPIAKITAVNENVAWALWNIQESEAELHQFLANSFLDWEELDEINHQQKRLEWLAGKLCLQQLLKNFNLPFDGVYKNLSGKPFLHKDTAFISLTHAFPYAAAIFNTKGIVGIDIELVKDKILRIAPRFMSEQELSACNNNTYKATCIWIAKEAIYKAMGIKGVVFSKDIQVIALSEDWQNLSGHALVDGKHFDFRLKTYLIEKHVVCINY